MGRPSRQEKQGTVHLGTGSAPNDPSGPLRPSVEGGGPRALSPLYAPLPVDPLWGGWGRYTNGAGKGRRAGAADAADDTLALSS